jgi:putative glycosyltransferase
MNKTLSSKLLVLLKNKHTEFSDKLYFEHPYKYTFYGLDRILSLYNIETNALMLKNKDELLQDTYTVSPDKLHYIPNTIPSMSPKEKANVIDHKGDLKEELGILPNERIVLYVGCQAKTKGIYELLQAFERIYHDNLLIRLVIVGEIRDFSELVRFIPKSVAHIIYTGLIDAKQLRKWYTVADIGILPTYTEQCSYVGLEMMKYIGVVVTTDAWGVKDMFQDGINAIVAPLTYDSCTFVENLKNAIKRGLTLREKERKILETNCLQTLKDKYNTVSMQNSYEQLISSLS